MCQCVCVPVVVCHVLNVRMRLMPVNIHTYISRCIYSYIHTIDIHTFIHTSIHTYIHSNIDTYRHINSTYTYILHIVIHTFYM